MIENEKRPLITFALVTYNQEQFISEAVKGALAQTYSPLEIILSDDCSIDRTVEIMKELIAEYQGPHKIILNLNPKNLGIGGHFNRLMELANGQLIVGGAGDDISLPERCEKIYQAWLKSHKMAKSIFSKFTVIDETGHQFINMKISSVNGVFSPSNFFPEALVNKDSILSGCTHAWTRDVFDIFGPLLTPLVCEDVVIPFRSSLIGSIYYIDEPLVMYRKHSSNISVWDRDSVQCQDFASWERFLPYERKSILSNWLSDLKKVEELMPERNKQIENLKNIVMHRLNIEEENIKLINSSIIEKCILLLKSALNGEKFLKIKYKFGIYVVPRFYNFYMRNKIRYMDESR